MRLAEICDALDGAMGGSSAGVECVMAFQTREPPHGCAALT
jgi:hypothetical protein